MSITADRLHVVTTIINPMRYKSRYKLYSAFENHVKQAGATLTIVEVAFGERPFEVTQPNNINHVQLRTNTELWHKENAINLGINRLPMDAKYIAWVDADVEFVRKDWAEETIHQLQHYDFVQMFSHAQDLGPNNEPLAPHTGFGFSYVKGLKPVDGYDYCKGWHPGYAWAARRSSLDAVGGLIDFAILGSGDKHMAMGLIGQAGQSLSAANGKFVGPYLDELVRWQDRAEKHIRRNLGYVPGMLLHGWHGKKKDRRYADRWRILMDNKFDPDNDIKCDTYGLWQWNDKSGPDDARMIRLRDQVRGYFRARNEDSIDV